MRPGEVHTLAQVPLFAGLPSSNLLELHTIGVRRAIPAGAQIFLEDSPATTLFVLLSGRARVTRCGPEGQVVVLHFADPGDVLGCAILGGARTYPGTAELLEDSALLAFDEGAIERLVERFPAVSRNALKMLSGRMEDLRTRLQEMTTDRVDQRIAHALLRLFEGAGAGPMRLSRQEVAELAGTTQYTVSRTLTAWEKRGWLSCGRQRIRLLAPEALRDLSAGLDPPPLAL